MCFSSHLPKAFCNGLAIQGFGVGTCSGTRYRSSWPRLFSYALSPLRLFILNVTSREGGDSVSAVRELLPLGLTFRLLLSLLLHSLSASIKNITKLSAPQRKFQNTFQNTSILILVTKFCKRFLKR